MKYMYVNHTGKSANTRGTQPINFLKHATIPYTKEYPVTSPVQRTGS